MNLDTPSNPSGHFSPTDPLSCTGLHREFQIPPQLPHDHKIYYLYFLGFNTKGVRKVCPSF